MINELAVLNSNLRANLKAEISSNHPFLTTPKRGDGFIFGIGPGAKIEKIEFCTKESISSMWVIGPDNQKRFPVINLKIPLWKVTPAYIDLISDKDKNQDNIAVRLDAISQIINTGDSAYLLKDLKRLKARIYDYPNTLLTDYFNGEKDIDVIVELIKRLEGYKDCPEKLLEDVSRATLKECREGWLDIEKAETLLFGNRDKKKNVFKEGDDITVILDLSDYYNFDCRITDNSLKQRVNTILNKKEVGKSEKLGLCALTGQNTSINSDSFPKPKLPIIGPTFLFFMNKDSRCNTRYGKTGSAIFPVDRKVVVELQDALRYITDESRKGQTWQKVSGSQVSGQPDLLIAYPEEKIDVSVDLAEFLSEVEDEDEIALRLYETKASKVCEALIGKEGLKEDSLIRIFVLNKINEGQRQIVCNKYYTVSQIVDGVNRWTVGSKNHPTISILMPPKQKGEKAIIKEPDCPFPSVFMRCFQNQWIRQGQDKNKKQGHRKNSVPGCSLSDVYEVIFGDSNYSIDISKRLMKIGLERLKPLLLGAGQAIHKSEDIFLSKDARENLLTAVSIFSILLFKIDHFKEEYMKEAAFNTGRLLALADRLHREYCKHVSKNDPAQLLGNSLMPIALENPERAIARLSDRIRIYQAWAQKTKEEETKLAKWFLGRIGETCNVLRKLELPNKTVDSQKAQILLGYLCKIEKEKSEESLKEDEEKNTKQ